MAKARFAMQRLRVRKVLPVLSCVVIFLAVLVFLRDASTHVRRDDVHQYYERTVFTTRLPLKSVQTKSDQVL